MNPENSSRYQLFGVAAYLVLFVGALAWVLVITLLESSPAWIRDNALAVRCGLSGGLGGAIYLLRAVYLRCCVYRDWTSIWIPWYLIRPLISTLCGIVAFVFLSAGLMILDAARADGGNEFGFYALAILAGLNVDRFILRVEEVSKATFGIEKSRTAEKSSNKDSSDST
ncbi:hypothetical protein ACFSSA_09255 [Luteolibacter algae]|uniref:Uncharacterized protein n=1 Tax=Luteolibacter algae TaxID=454151 RepID=A0ABW5D7N4_9BACT